ncbi:MAG: tetratricopeptide repeat protein [Fimbriimonadaceae bacterium]|nr:tetratricopeptide repeat protein [Fimbriimonadaceae bacterium]QYK56100.1 MAG: tetratricopeptide repeat protein [Fimbriimonadaceae bacterium]
MAHVGKWFGFGRNASFDAGVRAYEAGRFEEAVEEFRAASATTDLALRQRAKSYLAGALGRLGRLAMERGDVTGAIQLLGDAVAMRPRYADLHMALAMAHEALGEHGKRNEEVDAALRINPKYGFAVLWQASLMIASGDHGNGLARAVQAVSLDRRLETDTFREAIAMADRDEWDAAALKLRQVRAEQQDPDALAMLGDRMMAHGRYADAEQAYRTAIELQPGFADLHVRYGQALLEVDQVNRAEDEFRQAIAINEGYAEAHALLGVTLRRLNRDDEAREAFKTALAHDPNQVIAGEEISRLRP